MGCNVENQSVTFLLYRNIKNMKHIKDLLLKDQLQAAVVNPTYIYHADQLLVAAHKSLYCAKNRQMKTKSIFTEVLYSLFPSKSIRDSLKMIGAQEQGTDAVFVIFNDSAKDISKEIGSLVEGELVSLENIGEVNDLKSIRKLYKISDVISDNGDILNCIITKIASKDLLL